MKNKNVQNQNITFINAPDRLGGKKAGLATIIALCALSLAACEQPRRHDEPSPGFRADAGPGYAAAPQDPGLNRCFNARNVSNWRVIGKRTVNLGVGASQVYQLTLMGDCPDLDIRETMAIESSGGSEICNANNATIIVRTPIGPRRCHVRDMRRMSEAEIHSLRPEERP